MEQKLVLFTLVHFMKLRTFAKAALLNVFIKAFISQPRGTG